MTNTEKGARPGANRPGARISVSPTPDRDARRIRLHHDLVRRRRWVKAMDRSYGRWAA